MPADTLNGSMTESGQRLGAARRAAVLALAGAFLYLLALPPSLYATGEPLGEESLLFGIIRVIPFVAAAIALFNTRGSAFGAGALVGASLAALRFVLLYLAQALTESGIGPGVMLLTLAQVVVLFGAWFAGKLVWGQDVRLSAPHNLHFTVLASMGGVVYAAGEVVPKLNVELGPGVLAESQTAFSRFDALTVVTLLGMALIVGTSVIGSLLRNVPAGAGLVAGSTVILIGEVASALTALGGPYSMNIGVPVQLVGSGLLVVSLFVVTPAGRHVSGT